MEWPAVLRTARTGERPVNAVAPVRCAIYTRKSPDEGLEQSFNSLHAQREACEAYIRSQAGEGWAAIPDHYDDGGYSGGAMDRPALRQLLAEVAAKRVDVVVVYKVDRLTRFLPDSADFKAKVALKGEVPDGPADRRFMQPGAPRDHQGAVLPLDREGAEVAGDSGSHAVVERSLLQREVSGRNQRQAHGRSFEKG
ncbi:recombinase family protein [Phenylobacterium sp.]|uniref:recombinase family protein n=1 Tax=Phenylobacterium sp. TaxID=1871053 RepID=UPI003982FF6E